MYKRGFVDGEYQDGEVRGLTFVAGAGGMGKTTEMERLGSVCSGGAVFYDSLGEHSFKGWTIVHQPRDLKALLLRNRNKRFRILYQPMEGENTDHFRNVCQILKITGKWLGGVVFLVDEVDMHCGAEWGDTRMPPELYDFAQYGRHRRVSVVATARYPNQVARGLISQCRSMRLFYMDDPEHVDHFRKKCGPKVATAIQGLKPYQYVIWWRGVSEIQFCGGRR